MVLYSSNFSPYTWGSKIYATLWGEVFLEFKNFLTCEFINVGIGGFFQTCKDMMENKIVDSNVNLMCSSHFLFYSA